MKYPWRFQGDIAYGETDPIVTVFRGDIETDEDTGAQTIRQDTRNPVKMKLSELVNAIDLIDAGKMNDAAIKQKADVAIGKLNPGGNQ